MKNLYYFILKCVNLIRGILFDCVYVGQYATNRNLGDALNLIIVPALTGKRVIPRRYCFEWDYNRHMNLQCIGSVVVDVNAKTILCGAGAISENVRVQEKPACVLSVRGPLTRELLLKQGIDCPEVYGDPALYVCKLYCVDNQITIRDEGGGKLGFVPHYVDQDKEIVQKIANMDAVGFIDILLSPAKFVHSIYKEWKPWIDHLCSYDVIISSSMHGLILGDAYGIPTLWVKFGDDVIGNDFKFYDYYASLGLTKEDIAPIYIAPDTNITVEYIEELRNMATKKPVERINIERLIKQLRCNIK